MSEKVGFSDFEKQAMQQRLEDMRSQSKDDEVMINIS